MEIKFNLSKFKQLISFTKLRILILWQTYIFGNSCSKSEVNYKSLNLTKLVYLITTKVNRKTK